MEPAQRPNRNRGSVAAFFGVSGGINNGVGIPKRIAMCRRLRYYLLIIRFLLCVNGSVTVLCTISLDL